MPTVLPCPIRPSSPLRSFQLSSDFLVGLTGRGCVYVHTYILSFLILFFLKFCIKEGPIETDSMSVYPSVRMSICPSHPIYSKTNSENFGENTLSVNPFASFFVGSGTWYLRVYIFFSQNLVIWSIRQNGWIINFRN